MNKLEAFMNVINATEGLDISIKIGKESELVVKGDFLKIVGAIGKGMDLQDKHYEDNKKIEELELEIKKLKLKA